MKIIGAINKKSINCTFFKTLKQMRKITIMSKKILHKFSDKIQYDSQK